jgi:hypothetical protein
VGDGTASVKAIITSLWGWGDAIFAKIVVAALPVQVMADVLLARAVGDTLFKGVFVN